MLMPLLLVFLIAVPGAHAVPSSAPSGVPSAHAIPSGAPRVAHVPSAHAIPSDAPGGRLSVHAIPGVFLVPVAVRLAWVV